MATQTEIQQRLVAYRTAESLILRNQSYTIGNRTFTRANLKHVQQMINDLQQQLDAFTNNGSIRTRKAIFRDD